MAVDPRIDNSAAIAACDAIVDLIDGGAGAGTLVIRTGTAPTDVDAAETGTLLATLTFSDPAFGNAADQAPGAQATANAITDDTSADATGTAGWFRAKDSDGNGIIQGSCGTSSADLILNTVSFVSGANISVSGYTFQINES